MQYPCKNTLVYWQKIHFITMTLPSASKLLFLLQTFNQNCYSLCIYNLYIQNRACLWVYRRQIYKNKLL